MKASELEAEFTDVLKPEYGVEGEKNGLIRGDPERDVTKVACCWSATESLLKEAVALGCNGIFAHEIWQIPATGGKWWPRPQSQDMIANKKRSAVYTEHNLAFFQYHSPLDGWPLWSTGRALIDALGYRVEDAEWPNRFVPVFDIEPQPLRQFAIRVRDRLGLKGVGLSEALEREVRRVALFIGGFGTGWAAPELARENGADVMVTGELLDYTVRCAREADIAVVKASHYSTENPSVKKFCEHMQARLSGKVRFIFLNSGESWEHYGASL